MIYYFKNIVHKYQWLPTTLVVQLQYQTKKIDRMRILVDCIEHLVYSNATVCVYN